MAHKILCLSRVPPISELVERCGGEGRSPDDPRNLRTLYARFVRKLSIRITWLILHTRLGANQVTVLGIIIGLLGAVLLSQANIWIALVALALLQLSFVIDFCDGEVARYYGTGSAGGAYLDWIGHYYVPAVAVAALAWSCLTTGAGSWVFVAAIVLILGFVRVAYSARDHVLLGLYRDDPQLRGSEQVPSVLYSPTKAARQNWSTSMQTTAADVRVRRGEEFFGGASQTSASCSSIRVLSTCSRLQSPW